MALPGLDLALATHPVLLVLAGVTGMLGAASIDLGPFAPVEQAALAEVVPAAGRNLAFGRYSMSGGLFNAAGGLAATVAAGGGRAFFFLSALIRVAPAVLPLFLSARVEGATRASVFGALQVRAPFGVLARLSALFALDSFAGGCFANAVLAYWLYRRFAG